VLGPANLYPYVILWQWQTYFLAEKHQLGQALLYYLKNAIKLTIQEGTSCPSLSDGSDSIPLLCDAIERVLTFGLRGNFEAILKIIAEHSHNSISEVLQ